MFIVSDQNAQKGQEETVREEREGDEKALVGRLAVLVLCPSFSLPGRHSLCGLWAQD